MKKEMVTVNEVICGHCSNLKENKKGYFCKKRKDVEVDMDLVIYCGQFKKKGNLKEKSKKLYGFLLGLISLFLIFMAIGLGIGLSKWIIQLFFN